MGGLGSGYYSHSNRKYTTNEARDFDIRVLNKKGWTAPGISFDYWWTCNGKPSGSIKYKILDSFIILEYRVKTNIGDLENIKQFVSLDETPCNYGGTRKWFICEACEKRVVVLYGVGKYFHCRTCNDLSYFSKQKGFVDRTRIKAQNIRSKLGGEKSIASAFPDKPKGMHWKTYNKLMKEAEVYEDYMWNLELLLIRKL